MNILILGASGPIGHYLLRDLKSNGHHVVSTYFTNKIFEEIEYKLDITDLESTRNLIKNINPDIVIDTVALSGVDLAETNINLANKVTVQGTQNVIDVCKLTKSKMIYVSTTAVYGRGEKIYSEDDTPHPVNYYGVTKRAAEELVMKSRLDHLILRTDHPYDWVRKGQKVNSVIRTLETLRAGNILKEVVDWYSVPAYLPDFAIATRKLIENNETGIFHITGPDYLNRYEWSLKVAEIFGLQKELIVPIKSDELKLPAKRGNVNVSNEKLTRRTGFVMKGITEGLLDMYKKYQINQ